MDHIGNRRYRILVCLLLRDYIEASTSKEQSQVVNTIMKKINEAAGPSGGFVKQDGQGDWFKIGSKAAHEKISHMIRYYMSDQSHVQACPFSSDDEGQGDAIQLAQDRILHSVVPFPNSTDDEVEFINALDYFK